MNTTFMTLSFPVGSYFLWSQSVLVSSVLGSLLSDLVIDGSINNSFTFTAAHNAVTLCKVNDTLQWDFK